MAQEWHEFAGRNRRAPLTLPRIQVSDAKNLRAECFRSGGIHEYNHGNADGAADYASGLSWAHHGRRARGLYLSLDELNYNPIAAELLNFGLLDGIYCRFAPGGRSRRDDRYWHLGAV